MNILIAEDNALSAKILELNLKKHGYSIKTVANGEEALKCLTKNHDVQLIITDIKMPYMSGFELIGILGEDTIYKEIPIVICTSANEIETVRQAVEMGVKYYIVKPIKADQLLVTVREVLGHDKPILLPQREVLSHLHIDRRAYGEMIRAFGVTIKQKISFLQKIKLEKNSRLSVDELVNLSESALLLGAQRLNHYLVSIIDKEKLTTYHYYYLLHELLALKDALNLDD